MHAITVDPIDAYLLATGRLSALPSTFSPESVLGERVAIHGSAKELSKEQQERLDDLQRKGWFPKGSELPRGKVACYATLESATRGENGVEIIARHVLKLDPFQGATSKGRVWQWDNTIA